MDDLKLDLTDAEWMSIIDQERDGLPYCCANLSNLRDAIIGFARYGSTYSQWQRMPFLRAYLAAEGSHDLEPVVVKVFKQIYDNDETFAKFYDSQNHGDEEVREIEMPT